MEESVNIYEYKQFVFDFFVGIDDLVSKLNDVGKAGWKVHSQSLNSIPDRKEKFLVVVGYREKSVNFVDDFGGEEVPDILNCFIKDINDQNKRLDTIKKIIKDMCVYCGSLSGWACDCREGE
jgi:hypothetical protein